GGAEASHLGGRVGAVGAAEEREARLPDHVRAPLEEGLELRVPDLGTLVDRDRDAEVDGRLDLVATEAAHRDGGDTREVALGGAAPQHPLTRRVRRSDEESDSRVRVRGQDGDVLVGEAEPRRVRDPAERAAARGDTVDTATQP